MGCAVSSSSTQCALHRSTVSPPPQQYTVDHETLQDRSSPMQNPIVPVWPSEEGEEEEERKWSTAAQCSDEPPLQQYLTTGKSGHNRPTSIVPQPAVLCWKGPANPMSCASTFTTSPMAHSDSPSDFVSINGISVSSRGSSNSSANSEAAFCWDTTVTSDLCSPLPRPSTPEQVIDVGLQCPLLTPSSRFLPRPTNCAFSASYRGGIVPQHRFTVVTHELENTATDPSGDGLLWPVPSGGSLFLVARNPPVRLLQVACDVQLTELQQLPVFVEGDSCLVDEVIRAQAEARCLTDEVLRSEESPSLGFRLRSTADELYLLGCIQASSVFVQLEALTLDLKCMNQDPKLFFRSLKDSPAAHLEAQFKITSDEPCLINMQQEMGTRLRTELRYAATVAVHALQKIKRETALAQAVPSAMDGDITKHET